MSESKVYVRTLGDNSGFGVFFGDPIQEPPDAGFVGGSSRWEECLGVGNTEEDALQDYRARKERKSA